MSKQFNHLFPFPCFWLMFSIAIFICVFDIKAFLYGQHLSQVETKMIFNKQRCCEVYLRNRISSRLLFLFCFPILFEIDMFVIALIFSYRNKWHFTYPYVPPATFAEKHLFTVFRIFFFNFQDFLEFFGSQYTLHLFPLTNISPPMMLIDVFTKWN